MLAANCLALATQDGCDIAAARDTLQELVGDQRLGPDGTERCRETLRSLEPVELAAPLPVDIASPETSVRGVCVQPYALLGALACARVVRVIVRWQVQGQWRRNRL